VGLALVLLVPLTSACQSSTESSAAPDRLSRSDAQATLASNAAPTKVGIHQVHGRLPVARRKVVRRQVGAVVDRWWEAAYLGGTYPRSSFPAAFPGFTAAAEQRARADKALLTNQTAGPRIVAEPDMVEHDLGPAAAMTGQQCLTARDPKVLVPARQRIERRDFLLALGNENSGHDVPGSEITVVEANDRFL
jgi:hypothetical protein